MFIASNNTARDTHVVPKGQRKEKAKKLLGHALWFTVATVVSGLALLLYRPLSYRPIQIDNKKQVSPYLTHQLLPQLYNAAQQEKPFDICIPQNGLNSIVAHTFAYTKSPKHPLSMIFSEPAVVLASNEVALMGKTRFLGNCSLITTIKIRPKFNKRGLLNLYLSKVKLGAVNITPLAKVIAKRAYKRHATTHKNIDADLAAEIAGSLLYNYPFHPIFKIDDKKVQIKKIIIAHQKLTISLSPAVN